jgi:hypothetical protein
MTGKFRFFRQAAGRGAFCEIHVIVVDKDAQEPDILVAISDAKQSADPSRVPEWFSAATTGIQQLLSDLHRQGKALGKQVRIERLISTHADARPDSTAVAAFMAAADAFGEKDNYRLEHRDGWWHVERNEPHPLIDLKA